MPVFSKTSKEVLSGVPLGGMGAGKLELLPNGLFNAFTFLNNWSQPLTGHAQSFPGVLGYHLGVYVDGKAYLLQTVPLANLPTVRSTGYDGSFPKSVLTIDEPSLGLRISVEAFSSWIPQDAKNSSLPCVYFSVKVKNLRKTKSNISLLFMGRNVCGDWCVGRENRVDETKEAVHLEFNNRAATADDPKKGSIRFSFQKAGWRTTYMESWNAVTRNFHFSADEIRLSAWEHFSKDGLLPNTKLGYTAQGENQELCGAVAAARVFAKGEEQTWNFTAAWYFPKHLIGHKYSEWFKSASEVQRYADKNRKRFGSKIDQLHRLVRRLPFPDWFHDALLTNLAPFFSSTWYARDGRFVFYEAPVVCPLMGTVDVGFYGSVPLAFFFPELEISQLMQFAKFQRKDGYIPHDLGRNSISIPSNGTTFYFWKDLNPKFALMAYRDYLWSKDEAFLKKIYPRVKKAMLWAIESDKDGDGLPDHEGADQTFDLWDFRGANSYTAGIFLAALLASRRLAETMKDSSFAKECDLRFWRGRESFDRELWNGDYFGKTCALSQLNGQWYADLLGLGDIADPRKINRALNSILSMNTRISKFGMVNSVLANNQLDTSNNHSKNIWFGMNYAFISLCLMRGLPTSKVMKPAFALWNNVTNKQKNPWNQPDMIDSKTGQYVFGDSYYRNMAIWSIPIAAAKKDAKTARILSAIRNLGKKAIMILVLGAVIPMSEMAATAATPEPTYEQKTFYRSDAEAKATEMALDDAENTLPGGHIKISGRYRLAAGATSNDFIVNDSNADLQERNYRQLYGERQYNTFDSAIYSQHLVNIDFSPKDKWSSYLQIVNDPWSWVGQTGEQIQTSDIGGEELRYNLRAFGANNATLGAIARSNVTDSVAFPPIKIKDGRLTGGTVIHGFYDYNPATNGIPFTIPELDLDYEYRPVRKAWVDYNEDLWHARLFLLADEKQALTTDDPLMLSNHKDYWQQSPWLYEYKPIQFFSDGSVKRGYYSDETSFLARDSEGNRLVLLRGASLEAAWDTTYFAGTVAAPYSPWDESYMSADNVPGAFRLKHQINEELMVGGTYTFRTGLIDNSVADFNQVVGIDAKYQVNATTELKAEVAGSHRERDLLTNEAIKSSEEGYAFKLAADSSYEHENDGKSEWHLSFTQMDPEFDPVLSRYSNTRDDHFWGNHLTFTDYSPDLEYFRIGDGVDRNRMVIRARWKEKLFKERFQNLFDVRNVHKTSNTAYLETVVRDEISYKFTDKFTAKGLVRWHGMPETTGGVEPFLSSYYFVGYEDPASLRLQNIEVPGDVDADRYTYSVGGQYVFNPQWTAEGFYERTNDIPDFPRGLLNGAFRDANDRVDGLLLDRVTTFLYGQSHLGAIPPYDFFNIFRERVIFKPDEHMKIIFHAAQNEYNIAAGIDDNVNHAGVSVQYDYSKQMTFFMDYTHSRILDVPKLIDNNYSVIDVQDHHNFYASFDYRINSSTVFRSEYGAFGIGTNTPLVTPYSVTSFALPTVDTEHLFRVYLTGDF